MESIWLKWFQFHLCYSMKKEWKTSKWKQSNSKRLNWQNLGKCVVAVQGGCSLAPYSSSSDLQTFPCYTSNSNWASPPPQKSVCSNFAISACRPLDLHVRIIPSESPANMGRRKDETGTQPIKFPLISLKHLRKFSFMFYFVTSDHIWKPF